ncbi:MAG: hypothetical protein ABI680_01685 [Chthoniobacteraceae bacterium]
MRPLLAFAAAICVGLIAAYPRVRISRAPQYTAASGGGNGSTVLNAIDAAAPNAKHLGSSEDNSRSDVDATASLKTALSSIGPDSLTAESALYEALQNFSAQDFQRITHDAEAFEKLIKPVEKSWLVHYAFMAGFIERWLEVDEHAAFAWLETRPKFVQAGANAIDESAMGIFARVRPEGTLAWILKQPVDEARQGMVEVLIRTLGETNLDMAKDWIGRFDDKVTREAAERGHRAAWAKVDPFGAIDGASKLASRDSVDVWQAAVREAVRRGANVARLLADKAATNTQIALAVQGLARLDPSAAADVITAKVEKSPDDVNTYTTQNVATEFASRDLDQARAWADALPEKQRIAALGAVTTVWAATDPRAAMEWLEAHPARAAADPAIPLEKRQDAATQVFAAWLARDEAAARNYARTLPAGGIAETIQSSLITYLTENGRPVEAAALLTEMDDTSSGVLAGRVASSMSRDDPMAAAVWAASLPPGPNQTMAVTAAARAWAGRDPASVATWIEQFPGGEVRDRAISAYTETIISLDPSAAAEWVLQVEDPWYRATTAQNVFWAMRKRDPAGAREWLANLPGVDETVRRVVLEAAQ